MKRAILLGLLLAGQAWATDHEAGRNFPAGSGGVNAPWAQDKPYLVLVSIDGFRWDYPDLYPTPAISRLINEGHRAERLIPAWPTLTFPNHFSIVTGQEPTAHGLVGNEFFDPESRRWYRISDRAMVGDGSFYQAEPLWVTAETRGMVSAAFFWVGSEADVMGVRPTHWRDYDKLVSGEDRVDQVLNWLAEPPSSRPHFYTLYFEGVDDHAHWTGPGSSKFMSALEDIDSWLARLLDGISTLPHGDRVNVVLVSDHGQMPYRDDDPFVLQRYIDLQGLAISDGGPFVFAWQNTPDEAAAEEIVRKVNRKWKHGQAYTRASAPSAWGVADNPRMPHLVFQADPGYAVISSRAMNVKVTSGDHGWAPEVPEMHGIFIAWGAQVGDDLPTGALRTSEVQPILLDILSLKDAGE